MSKTKIEWAEETWNPTLGCSKKSPGCKNCYAMRQVYRMAHNPNPKIGAANAGLTVLQGGQINWTGKINFIPDRLSIPLRTKKPTTYFVNSLSDLFHENVTDEQIDQVFAVMALCPQHTFQVLTKEPTRMKQWFKGDGRHRWHDHVYNRAYAMSISRGGSIGSKWPLPNVWLGVSVENQQYADERIPLLLQTQAAVRFISAEPLLGPVDFRESIRKWRTDSGIVDLRESAPHINWVIAGGESGPGARPAHPDWFRDLRDQCQAAGVPFFFKQWGEWVPGENLKRDKGMIETATWFGDEWSFQRESLCIEFHREDEPHVYHVGKKAAGALLDGVEWRQMPEVLTHA